MPLTKCPTVRSGGTIRFRSALMPILMMSRASMISIRSYRRTPGPIPRDGAGGRMGDAVEKRALGLWVPAFAGTTRRLFLRSGGALDECLAALHLVVQRRLVDLDHDIVGIDAEILHQRLGDVAHHADLLFFRAARGHADRDLRHFGLPL